MRRIIVMGPPGSGKSTLARELGACHGLPVFHLDQAYWTAGWVEAPRELFVAEVERLAGLDAWVIDGNYVATLGPRLPSADTIVYLDVSSLTAVVRILRRTLLDYGRVRADVAPGCDERLSWSFLRFVWSWNRLRRASHLAKVYAFRGRKVVVRSRTGRALLLRR